MDKIKLSSADVEYILAWRDEHKELVRKGMTPLKAVKMLFPEVGYTITAIRNKNALSFSITKRGRSLGRLFFTVKDGMYHKTGDTTKLTDEEKQTVLTVYASTMALLVFGRTTIESDETPREIGPAQLPAGREPLKQRQQKGFTYVLQRHSTASRGGRHRSPRGEFSVRGHYRHYKSGKAVWIAEYKKGTGKKLSTKYKLMKEA